MEILLINVCLLFVGASKGFCDLLQFKYTGTIFVKLPIKWQRYLDPKTSWENKWKWSTIYKGGYPIPVRKEKFWGSSRWLVWTTDAWHLLQFFMIKFIFIAVALHTDFTWWDITWVLSFYAGFWITYESKLLKR